MSGWSRFTASTATLSLSLYLSYNCSIVGDHRIALRGIGFPEVDHGRLARKRLAAPGLALEIDELELRQFLAHQIVRPGLHEGPRLLHAFGHVRTWKAFGIDFASQAGTLEIDHQPDAAWPGGSPSRLRGPVAIGTTICRKTKVF